MTIKNKRRRNATAKSLSDREKRDDVDHESFEDFILSVIARFRDRERAKMVSHEDAWK